MSLFKTKRNKIIVSGAVLSVFVLLAIFWFIGRRSQTKNLEGIYITAGGESYLVLKQGITGSLVVEHGEFNTIYPAWYFGGEDVTKGFRFTTNFNKGILTIRQNQDYNSGSSSWHLPDEYNIKLCIQCSPSETTPGDWDLIWGEMKCIGTFGKGIFSKEFWKDITSIHKFKNIMGSFSKHHKTELIMHLETDASDEILPSILHRVDDKRIADYFNLRQEGKINDHTLDLIRDLARDHPGDPYLELHLVEMEALQGDKDLAFSLLEKWNTSHDSFPDPLLQESARRVFQTVSDEIIRKNSPDLKDIMEVFNIDKPRLDLKETRDFYKSYFRSGQMFFFPIPVVLPWKTPGYNGRPVPNFLSLQANSIVMRVLATFYLFQGKREESLELFASVYHMGQSLNSHGVLIQRLIGIAIRGIASEGLKIYVLNACETREEFHKCWAMLTKLHNTRGQEHGSHLSVNTFPLITSHMKYKSGVSYPNIPEAETRHKTSDMKFQLVRMALAARYCLFETGEFPSSQQHFAPFFREELPKDTFTENDALRFTRLSKNEMAVYSVGPDGDDDRTKVRYDPTNGAITDGDIFITIPREREFAFPREGVRAKNAYELLEQFPNGLPADPFANTRGLPFSIIESTDKDPLVIFSFGPNTDQDRPEQRDHRSGYFRPELAFDFQVMGPHSESQEKTPSPSPTPTPTPVCTPPFGENAGYARRVQKVFRKGTPKARAPGYWILGPMYDPTNGTVSNGDLFIEIPR